MSNLNSSQEHNLYQIMKERQTPFSEEEIRGFMTQILQGLAHMHRNGYFHRDLKPGEILFFIYLFTVYFIISLFSLGT